MTAYVVAQLEITDPDTYAAYTSKVTATILQYGGKFIVRGGPYEVLEGDYPQLRFVIVAFADVEAAKTWYDSPEYQPLIALREKSTRGTLLLVQGT